MGKVAAQLRSLLEHRKASLPCFESDNLAIASDYGGTNSRFDYETLSFVICDLGAAGPWITAKDKLRKTHLPDNRRIAFKKMNDQHCRDALCPFLSIADRLPGVCATFAIDKDRRVGELFSGFREGIAQEIPDTRAAWHPIAFERLMRICGFCGLFLSLLTKPKQNVIWVSDDDEMMQSPLQRRLIRDVFAKVVSLYLPIPLGKLQILTTSMGDETQDLEDLAAIADLVAGATADSLTDHKKSGALDSKRSRAFSNDVESKTEIICRWLAHSQTSLLKLTCLLRMSHEGALRLSWQHFA